MDSSFFQVEFEKNSTFPLKNMSSNFENVLKKVKH